MLGLERKCIWFKILVEFFFGKGKVIFIVFVLYCLIGLIWFNYLILKIYCYMFNNMLNGDIIEIK